MTPRSGLLDPVYETDQSSTQPVYVGHDLVSHLQVSELRGKVDLTIEFAQRSKSDSEEPNEFLARPPTRTFCDIRRDRHRRRSHLRGQAVSLLPGEVQSESIDLLPQDDAVLPHHETPKVAHSRMNTGSPVQGVPLRHTRHPDCRAYGLWPMAYGLWHPTTEPTPNTGRRNLP